MRLCGCIIVVICLRIQFPPRPLLNHLLIVINISTLFTCAVAVFIFHYVECKVIQTKTSDLDKGICRSIVANVESSCLDLCLYSTLYTVILFIQPAARNSMLLSMTPVSYMPNSRRPSYNCQRALHSYLSFARHF